MAQAEPYQPCREAAFLARHGVMILLCAEEQATALAVGPGDASSRSGALSLHFRIRIRLPGRCMTSSA